MILNGRPNLFRLVAAHRICPFSNILNQKEEKRPLQQLAKKYRKDRFKSSALTKIANYNNQKKGVAKYSVKMMV
jgi:hypothetical protein